MQLGRDFTDLLECFSKHQVEYLIVGGYATSVYARPRYTKDLDVWVRPSQENAHKILASLSDFGFGSLGLQVEDFSTAESIVQLGREPNRIDILTALKGVEFDSCYARAKWFGLESKLRVSLIARSDLLINKRAVGRPQDLADVAAIESHPEPIFEE